MKLLNLVFNKRWYLIVLNVFLGLYPAISWGLVFSLPSNGDNVIGEIQIVHSRAGDNFSSLGRRYDIGYYELVEANPGVDPNLPKPGTLIIIPSRFILPPAPHHGIIVNLAELRLYYYLGTNQVATYPVGIGREGWSTPIGTSNILKKVVDPTWVVPDSIREYRATQGVDLPKSIPPGPENPLGGYALRLGFPGYLIHGTNDSNGVGRRSSSGCIRMYPEDIEELFASVKVGMPLRILNLAYKIGKKEGAIYLEAHLPLQEYDLGIAPVANLIREYAKHTPVAINWEDVKIIGQLQNGIPLIIGRMIHNTDFKQLAEVTTVNTNDGEFI